jgi:phosphohistidine swiveling domain-containing protein
MTAIDVATRAYLVDLHELTRGDWPRAGHKAATLGELQRAGFSVPEGVVLTVEAFEAFRAVHGFDDVATPAEVESAPLPAEVERVLRTATQRFDTVRLAVRSSGLAEDLPGASFAGQYETVLDVRGPDAVVDAVRHCWASAFDSRVAAYRATLGDVGVPGMAVVIQRLVPAEAAGVAFTANPVTGDRAEAVVSAVRGLGERLVAGEATPDEWIVRGGEAVARRISEGSIDAGQARAVADLARRVELHLGAPQDIEWAIAEGKVVLLQARPMTALPEPTDWRPPLPGGWARNLRLGEWLGDPVTPLFESWLLTRLENRFHEGMRTFAPVPFPRPLHVVVNGWYFYSLSTFPTSVRAMAWIMVRYFLPSLLVRPRRAVMMIPQTAHFGVELLVREWRESVLPRHRAVVARGEAQVDRLAPEGLVALIDELADDAGEYFFSIMAVAGFATKAEIPLAAFYRRHLHPRVGGTHLSLLRGLFTPSLEAYGHAVEGLDWVLPTLAERGALPSDAADAAARRSRLEAERTAAEQEARAALAGEPKLLARFDKLVAPAQRFQPLREEQVYWFTLGWPLMRRAVRRLGELLHKRGKLADPDEVFFITRDELLAALGESDDRRELSVEAVHRRAAWDGQRRLVPPLVIGEVAPMFHRFMGAAEEAVRMPGASGESGLRGIAASPGRVTGPVCIIRTASEFDRLRPGDVLVAPITTPAWTPLFATAAAVVTDTGGVASHSSVVAREYGIPAVVGTGDATRRLRDGQIVTVDGAAGLVHPAS